MVEWKPIEDLGPYFGGLTGKTKDDFVDGNAKFITYMNVFTNPSLDVSTTGVVRINKGERQNRIQKGDILFTGSSETPEEAGMSCVVTDELNDDYYMNSFCFGIRLNQPEQYNLGYLKHILRSFNIRKEIAKSASGVTRFNISKARFGKIRIPIPSLSEQQRVVDILDTFTSSIENLKEQIAQRRNQYEYYRDQLLDLKEKEGVEMKTLGKVCALERGVRVVKKDLQEEGVIPVYQNSLTPLGFFEMSNYPEDTTFVICAGAAGEVGYSKVAFWAADDCTCIVCPPSICSKYVYNYLNTKQYLLKSQVRKASVPRLSKDVIGKLSIPIPSLSEQQRIVSILDTFEMSIVNLEAQLAQREKQYEYYRNKLLTFE